MEEYRTNSNRRNRILFYKSFLIIFLFCQCYNIYAAETPIELSDEAIKIAQTEYKGTWIDTFNKARQKFADKYGTIFGLVIDYQHQLILQSKTYDGKDRGSGYYNLEVQQRLWKGAAGVIQLEGGGGYGIDALLPTYSIYDGNAGEPNLFYIPVLYFKQNLFDDSVYINAGKLDLSTWCDINYAANSADTQFLSSALVYNISIPFPQKGMGIIAGVKPKDLFYFQAGVSNVDSISTKTGISDLFDNNFNAFIMSEFGITPKIYGKQGNYRFMIWVNDKEIQQFNGNEPKDNDSGFALSFDQEITKNIMLFLRYGLADPDVREISGFWSAGAQITAPLPFRKNDWMGVGVSLSIISGDFRKFNSPEDTHAETIYEVYYGIQLHPVFNIIPCLQVITNPSADKSRGTEIVGTVRAVVII